MNSRLFSATLLVSTATSIALLAEVRAAGSLSCLGLVESQVSRVAEAFRMPSFALISPSPKLSQRQAVRQLIEAITLESDLYVRLPRLLNLTQRHDHPTQHVPSALVHALLDRLSTAGSIRWRGALPELSAEQRAALRRDLGVPEATAEKIRISAHHLWNLGDQGLRSVLAEMDQSVARFEAPLKKILGSRYRRLLHIETHLDREDFTSKMAWTFTPPLLLTSATLFFPASAAEFGSLWAGGIFASMLGGGYLRANQFGDKRLLALQEWRLQRLYRRMALELNRSFARIDTLSEPANESAFLGAYARWAEEHAELRDQASSLSPFEVLLKRATMLSAVSLATESIEMPDGRRFADFRQAADFTAARGQLNAGAQSLIQRLELLRQETSEMRRAIDVFISLDELKPDPRLEGMDLELIRGQYQVLMGLSQSLGQAEKLLHQRQLRIGLIMRRLEAGVYDVSDLAR